MIRSKTLKTLLCSAVISLVCTGTATAKSAEAERNAPGGTTLTLTVDNIADVSGALMISVVDQAGYDGRPITALRVEVDAQTQTAVLTLPADGDYAVKMFHDIDGNGQMDMSPFGMPMEPFGFSNDARGRFGPPTWDQTKFAVQGPTAHTITLPSGT